MPSLLTLSDVFSTGHHCAVTAGVNARTTVTVIGDGAVGLSAVLAAKRLGAERIILMGRHKTRTDLGLEFGATDVVAERGEEGIERVRELTGGDGTHTVLECVGLKPAIETAFAVVRNGGTVSRVGAPQYDRRARRLRRVLPQHHAHRRRRAGPGLHRRTVARRTRRRHRTRQGLRPHRRPRRRPWWIQGHGRPRRTEGDGHPVSDWTSSELDAVGDADELHVATRRSDDTLRSDRIVWVVRQGDDLYVRSVNGPTAAWYRGVQTRHAGHISAGGVSKDVVFTEPDHDLDDALDAEYRRKYGHYSGPTARITAPLARQTTLRVQPA